MSSIGRYDHAYGTGMTTVHIYLVVSNTAHTCPIPGHTCPILLIPVSYLVIPGHTCETVFQSITPCIQ